MNETSGTFNYLSRAEIQPAYYLFDADSEEVNRLPEMQAIEMPVHDCRGTRDHFQIDKQGFAFVDFAPDFDRFHDRDAVREIYYPMVEAVLLAATGALSVKVFDHNVRLNLEAKGSASDRPVRFVHNDYTELSAPQRVKDIMGEAQGAELLKNRFAVINLWRPISGPVEDMPLGILDASSLAVEDFVSTDLVYRDRVGKIASVRPNQNHQWYYLSGMRTNEALLLKCFDSDTSGHARYTAHSAFKDAKAPENPMPRESIEARVLIFYAPGI
ncbi:MAG: CmcJ/NvfI family oxidoreductase [Gammaproteobacteria bacterium]